MILLTGATGLVGSAVLRRLIDNDQKVRCLVRNPGGLGPARVQVQIALGDLGNPESFRNAVRGVDTIIHLASTIRDQKTGSIEEINSIGTWRLVQAAKQCGVKRIIFFSVIGARPYSSVRFFRSKALAQLAVEESGLNFSVISPSIIYSPGDAWLNLLARFSLLPIMPVAGNGKAQFQPLWAEDVADFVLKALHSDEAQTHYEIAGPETLTQDDIIQIVLASLGKRRRLLHVPMPIVKKSLKALVQIYGPAAFATDNEAELMDVSLVSDQGDADMKALGINPKSMALVLGVT